MLLGEHCTGQNTMQCCRRDSRQFCIGKILCNVVPESPNNIVQENIQPISSKQNLVTAFT